MSSLNTLHAKPPDLSSMTELYDAMYEELFPWSPHQTGRERYGSDRAYYASSMAMLECFVDRLSSPATRKELSKPFNDPSAGWRKGVFRRFFHDIPRLVHVVSLLADTYSYNEHIEIFRETSLALGILDSDFRWDRLSRGEFPKAISNDPAKVYFELVTRLHVACSEQNIRLAIAQKRNEAKKRGIDYCKYIDAWFREVPRLIFIRLDLGYVHDQDQPVQAPQASKDLGRLLRNRAHNQLFTGWVGYIAKFEASVQKGLYWRVLLFFNGRERDGDGMEHIRMAQRQGEYWCSSIPGNRGRYWNCNAEYDELVRLGRCGIGPIHDDDLDLRKNLNEVVLPSLTKTLQSVRPKVEVDFKILRRGLMPPKHEG